MQYMSYSYVDLNIILTLVLFSYRARSSSSKLWPTSLEDIVTIFNKCLKIFWRCPFTLPRFDCIARFAPEILY